VVEGVWIPVAAEHFPAAGRKLIHPCLTVYRREDGLRGEETPEASEWPERGRIKLLAEGWRGRRL